MNKFSLSALGLIFLSPSVFAKLSLEAPFAQGEALVKLRPGSKSTFLAKTRSLSKRSLALGFGDFYLIKSEEKSTLRLVHELGTLPEVSYVEPNYIYQAIGSTPSVEAILAGTLRETFSSSSPNDPLYGKLWGLSNTGSNEPDRNGGQSPNPGVAGADIRAEKAWEISKGDQDIVIAVIDTGIDYNHPDLKNNMWVNLKEVPGNGVDDDQNGYVDDVYGWNAALDHGNPMDGNSHGTHCAGTIGAEHDNGLGVAGVMDKVQIMAVKFLSDSGSGSLTDAVEAIDYATKMNVDIMSNSWGGGGYSQALSDAITAAKNKGILFVAAAGNSSTNNDARPTYPANYEVDNVISVASHTAQDSLSSFSCFGRKTVHIAAPGSNILSSTPNGEYKVFSGTSMATPHVSGVIGLLLAENGRLPVVEVRERLMATSIPGSAYRRSVASGGRVSAYHFLTNTRIPRPGPQESSWKTITLSENFETPHPYQDNSKFSKTYTFPGAKYVKLVIEKYDTEATYDVLSIRDGNGVMIEKISGSGANYQTDYAETDSVSVEFSSDSSQTKWGVVIREAKVIY
jgi:thermitase